MTAQENKNPLETLRPLLPAFRERAAAHDGEDRFVHENYDELKAAGLFSVAIPAELGGGGAGYGEVCRLVREMGQNCSSTALAYAMHSHPVAANIYKYLHGMPAEATLRKIAGGNLIIAGTGANDWLGSSGHAEKVDGGYRVNARKHFVSGAPGADVFVTSVRYADGSDQDKVLHFSIPMASEGICVGDNWLVSGMRGTGSNDITMENVFVPETAIVAERPADAWHKMYNIIIPAAMPLIMSAYTGIAENAAAIARAEAGGRNDDLLPAMLGRMENDLTVATDALAAMIGLHDDYQYAAELSTVDAIFRRKTIITEKTKAVVDRAAEICGGRAFFRRHPMEQLVRDIRAARFHPMPVERQLSFTGKLAMDRTPL